MEKSVVITGKQRSCRLRKAKELVKNYHFNEVTWISDLHFDSPWFFSECTKVTKVIIISEITSINQISNFFNWVSNGITVNRKYKDPFYKSPYFILICKEGITPNKLKKQGVSFEARFDVIDTPAQEEFDEALLAPDPMQKALTPAQFMTVFGYCLYDLANQVPTMLSNEGSNFLGYEPGRSEVNEKYDSLIKEIRETYSVCLADAEKFDRI